MAQYSDEEWFRQPGRQELEEAAGELEDGKGRELRDLPR
jgi:hypothetical protein